jgi:hypothetical protein
MLLLLLLLLHVYALGTDVPAVLRRATHASIAPYLEDVLKHHSQGVKSTTRGLGGGGNCCIHGCIIGQRGEHLGGCLRVVQHAACMTQGREAVR